MTAFTSNLDYAPSAPTIVTRIVAAINAAVARAQTRYRCEQMRRGAGGASAVPRRR